MQLAHDNAFGAVDDKGSLFGHERNFAHVDFVFTDFLDRAGLGGVAVKNFKLNTSAQRGRIGQTAQLALGHIEFRLLESVAQELQAGVAIVAGDRENGSECRLQPDIFAAFGLYIGLQGGFLAA